MRTDLYIPIFLFLKWLSRNSDKILLQLIEKKIGHKFNGDQKIDQCFLRPTKQKIGGHFLHPNNDDWPMIMWYMIIINPILQSQYNLKLNITKKKK